MLSTAERIDTLSKNPQPWVSSMWGLRRRVEEILGKDNILSEASSRPCWSNTLSICGTKP